MTAAFEGGEWSAARPGRTLPPGKTQYPFYRRLGGPQGRSGRAENLVPTGIRSWTVQPVPQSPYRPRYRPTNRRIQNIKHTHICIYNGTQWNEKNMNGAVELHMVCISFNNDRHPVPKTSTPLHSTTLISLCLTENQK